MNSSSPGAYVSKDDEIGEGQFKRRRRDPTTKIEMPFLGFGGG